MRIVRNPDWLARNSDEIVIELVVAVEVLVNGYSIDARRQIGLNAEVLGVGGDRKKSVAECLIAVTRKPGR